MLALALGAQSSVVPYWGPASYTAVHGPTLYHAGPSVVVAAHPHAAISIAEHPYPVLHTIPAIHHVAPVVVAAPLVAAEGTYVAKTRGAVHVAPLPGHANSASSINLEAAPGTL